MCDSSCAPDHGYGEWGKGASDADGTNCVTIHRASMVERELRSLLCSCWETVERAEPVLQVGISVQA